LLDQADTVFGSGQEHRAADEANLKDLHAKIGELALEEALANYGTPEIFNSDQGCQFTSEDFTDVLKGNGIKISMDGKGRWMDNVFIERLWRSLKYEEVYLKAYDSVAQARQGIDDWLMFYNGERRHASLSRMTPNQVYYDLPSGQPIAA
jgi:putative transposase